MSESITELATALAAAQGELEGAIKDASNPHFKSRYADLEACVAAYRPAFAKHGLSVVQVPRTVEGGVQIITMILHKSGQFLSNEGDGLTVPVDRENAHGVGSAVTYGRRYLLCPMVGIAPEDDDGNAAANAPPKSRAKAIADEHGMTTADKLPPKAEPKTSAAYKTAIEKLSVAVRERDVNEVARIVNVADKACAEGKLPENERNGITHEASIALQKIKALENEPVAA